MKKLNEIEKKNVEIQALHDDCDVATCQDKAHRLPCDSEKATRHQKIRKWNLKSIGNTWAETFNLSAYISVCSFFVRLNE